MLSRASGERPTKVPGAVAPLSVVPAISGTEDRKIVPKEKRGCFGCSLRFGIDKSFLDKASEVRVRGWPPEQTIESLCANGGWGGPPKLFLSFFLSFFLLSGQVMVLVSSGFVHGMSPRGGPALGSGGLGGGLGGLGGVCAGTRTHTHT